MLRDTVLRALYRWYPFAHGKNLLRRRIFRIIRGVHLGRDDFGNALLLDLGNFIDATVFLDGVFEREGLDRLWNWISRTNCTQFVDVGANIGLYALRMAHHPSILKVHCFEPDPRNHAQLMGNIFLSGNAGKIEAHCIAASDTDGVAPFYVSRDATELDQGKLNTGTSALRLQTNRHAEVNAVKVRMCRLDTILPIVNEALAIKIDVEGHEAEVLEGAAGLLARNNCFILVEVFDANVPRVDSIMANLGYGTVAEFAVPDYRLYTKLKHSEEPPAACQVRGTP